mmetsp:Transcript_66131/g.196827  ORF Transcript_66131/g.196827 Transcript_66131/m.196827 type:complete len:146 (+) Transcript_66131:84-521(+)
MPKLPLREGKTFSCRLSARKHSLDAAISDGVGPAGAEAESIEASGETAVIALCGEPGGFDAPSQLQGPLPAAGRGGWQETALSERLCRNGGSADKLLPVGLLLLPGLPAASRRASASRAAPVSASRTEPRESLAALRALLLLLFS